MSEPTGLVSDENHLPTETRVAVLHAAGDLRIENRTRPEPGPGEVLIRVEAVGVCGSDTHYLRHGRIGEFVLDSPIVLGHEPAGIVAAVGPGVTRVEVGQRVSVEPGVPCGQCSRCRSGEYNLCPEMHFMATPPYDGAFADYIAWPEAFVHPVPDSMSAEDAALIEPLSVGVWANRRAGTGSGDDVLVSGAGPVGLLAADVAREFGARRVVVRDVDAGRLAVAAERGHAVELAGGPEDPAPDVSASAAGENGAEYDVLLECSGAPGILGAGLLRLRSRGRAVMIGLPAVEPELPLARLHHRELTVLTIFRYVNTWPAAIEMVASGRIRTAGIVTHRYGLDEAEKALWAASAETTCVKALVSPLLG